MYRDLGSDQEEDALLLNALANVVREAKKIVMAGHWHLPRTDWASESCAYRRIIGPSR